MNKNLKKQLIISANKALRYLASELSATGSFGEGESDLLICNSSLLLLMLSG